MTTTPIALLDALHTARVRLAEEVAAVDTCTSRGWLHDASFAASEVARYRDLVARLEARIAATTSTTSTTLPCPCGGVLQQHDASGAGVLLRPCYIDRGYTVFDQTRAADVEAPCVIWSCNRCERCAVDRVVQDAIGGAS